MTTLTYKPTLPLICCSDSQVDLVKKEGASAQQQVIRVAEQLNGLHSFQQTFWVSALRAQGMTKLKDFLTQRCGYLTDRWFDSDSTSMLYCAALIQTGLTATTAVSATKILATIDSGFLQRQCSYALPVFSDAVMAACFVFVTSGMHTVPALNSIYAIALGV